MVKTIKHECKQCGTEILLPDYVVLCVVECPHCGYRDLVITHAPVRVPRRW